MRRKLDVLAKQLYGKSSEQLDPNQLQLLLQGLEDPKKPQPPPTKHPHRRRPSSQKEKRPRLKTTVELKASIVYPSKNASNFPSNTKPIPRATK